MAKRRFRIDTGYYGGETVIGEVSNEFVKKALLFDEGDLVDTVLLDDWGGDDELDENAEHDDPEQIPSPREEYYMWECDDIEHPNSAYGDPEMAVFEVPDGPDDYDYDNELGNFTAIPCIVGKAAILVTRNQRLLMKTMTKVTMYLY